MQKKIFIAIPTYTGEIHYLTMESVLRAQRAAIAKGWECEYAIRPNDSVLTRCRNVLLTAGMSVGATDVVFWDADIAIDPDAFVKLCSHEVELVAGVYRARSDPISYVFNGPLDAQRDALGLIEVDGVATGMLRITRAAVDRLKAAYPDLWCHDRQLPGAKVLWFFDFARIGHDYFGEDFNFCRIWREAGGKVLVDPDMRILHTGMKTFDGHFGEFLDQRAAWAAPQAQIERHKMMLAAAVSDEAREGVKVVT